MYKANFPSLPSELCRTNVKLPRGGDNGEEGTTYEEGAMLYWVESAQPLHNISDNQWNQSKEARGYP